MTNKAVANTISVKYSDDEYKLLEGVFKNNNYLLKAVAKQMFQAPLHEREDGLIRNSIKTGDLQTLLKKIFLPSLEDDVEISWIGDSLDRIGGELMPLEVRTVENGVVSIKARLKVVEYCKQELERLFTHQEPVLKFKDFESLEGKDDSQIYIDFVARQEITNRIRNFLREIKIMSFGKPSEEEIAEFRQQNSSK